MTRNRYTAAIQGSGLWHSLRRAMASAFAGIRVRILVPQESERLDLQVRYNARDGIDTVTLTRSNWQTGEECTLYSGALTNGAKHKAKQLRE